MDPLSALGVAAAVIAFVDVGAKLVRTTGEITAKGSTQLNQRLQERIKSVIDATERFKAGDHDEDEATGTDGSQDSVATTLDTILVSMSDADISLKHKFDHLQRLRNDIADHEKSLLGILKQCRELSSEMLAVLEKLTSGNERRSLHRSITMAVRSIWSHAKIVDMAGQLSAIRSGVTMHTMLLLNTKTDYIASHQDARFDKLEQSNQDVVQVIAINQEQMNQKLDRHKSQLGQARNYSEALADKRHAEIIAAILTLRDGSTRYLKPQASLMATTSSHYDPQISQNMMALRLQEDSTLDVTVVARTNDFQYVHQRVLDCLHYRQMHLRLDAIDENHRDTFEWIFHDSTQHQNAWDDLVQWLETGAGCYWVNGKAGAGKSTLLKFVSSDPRYIASLEKWARGSRLVTASFFISQLGTALQRSQMGFLRTILHDILLQTPSLTPMILPDLCRELANGSSEFVPEDLTPAELRTAFKLLATQPVLDLHICLVVDGVDEYDGHPSDLAEFLTSISTPFNVKFKVLLSSRPEPACVDAFAQFPQLRLQDLTSNDVRKYVHDSLRERPRMLEMIAQESDRASKLMSDIVEKSAGVFLWVKLAVRSLLTGLSNFDGISELAERLDELPPDLETFYEYMIKKVPEKSRGQTSHMFQVYMQAAKVLYGEHMSALQLSFLTPDDVSQVFSRPIKPLTYQEIMLRVRTVEGRIRSRGCGLLEVREVQNARNFEERYRVLFFHKTVAEFLSLPKVWEDIVRSGEKNAVDPSTSLLSTEICLLKILPADGPQDSPAPSTSDTIQAYSWRDVAGNENLIWHHYFNAVVHAVGSQDSRAATKGHVDELRRVMTHFYNMTPDAVRTQKLRDLQSHIPFRARKDFEQPRQGWIAVEFSTFGFGTVTGTEQYQFLILAVAYGLYHYVDDELQTVAVKMSSSELSKVLTVATARFVAECRYPQTKQSSQLYKRVRGRALALYGEDAQSCRALEIAVSGESSRHRYANIMWSAIEHGADPNVVDAKISRSAWVLMLELASRSVEEPERFIQSYDSGGDSEIFVELLEAFVEAGASLQAVVPIQGRPSSVALDHLEPLFRPSVARRAIRRRGPLSSTTTTTPPRDPEKIAALEASWQRIRARF